MGTPLLLQRHDLVRLAPEGWCELRKTQAHHNRLAEPMALWARQGWPLIVARQAAQQPTDHVALGLPTPRSLGHLRLSLTVPQAAIASIEPLPDLATVFYRTGAPLGSLALDRALRQLGLFARVFGSFGWQALTGLDYVHDRSDLDLAIQVANWPQAIATVAVLEKAQLDLRIDGELIFPGHKAVPWCEVAQLVNGRIDSVLVKHVGGVALVDRSALQTAQETAG